MPTVTKKIGTSRSATGLMRSSIWAWGSVLDRIRPAAKAPMMVASPIHSAAAASASANAREDTTRAPRARSRPIKPTSHGARRKAMNTATTRKTTLFTARRAIPPSETPPVVATPVTTARVIRPRMSSTTAAPSTTLAAGSWSRPRSASTRAVMPTLVAVKVAPTKTATRPG